MKLKTLSCLLLSSTMAWAQTQPFNFTIDMSNAPENEYVIQLETQLNSNSFIDLSIPAWSPGYYQIMDFGKNVSDFSPKNAKNENLRWVKLNENTWRIYTNYTPKLLLDYKVKANKNFVGNAFIDKERAFIKTTALLLYPQNHLNTKSTILLKPYTGWQKIATGLDLVKGKTNEYAAPDFDTLYDSPILIGNLKELPEFTLQGKKHRFLGYNMGTFDEQRVMDDLKKIVKVSTDIFNDIPYSHYTFIGLGPGNGGIEQLNSTAMAFNGESLDGPNRNLTLSFFTHEYFHHFNAKRIRPIELGPFDYSAPNRTNLLWVAEGLTAYYENIIMNRAGLLSREEMFKIWGNKMRAFSTNEGRHKQTLAESSAKTWEDGPFGKKGETISYYEKGPLVGMILDLKIRVLTQNKKSLDDVMRTLYFDFYKKQNRGYSDNELREVAEKIAGADLSDIFQYIYTTKELDYSPYFNAAGINIDSNFSLSINPNLTTLQKEMINDLFKK